MRFAEPIYLVVSAVYILYILFRRRGVRNEGASFLFSSNEMMSGITGNLAVRISQRTHLLTTAAIVMALIALARPQIPDVTKSGETFGIDIVLTLDVSGSMRAEDLKPKNRLFAAKEVLKEFITSRRADRLGLVVFAGKSYTQSPLTTDYSILMNLLDDVRINHTDEGTAIGLAVSESLNRLKDSTAKSKVIILLTDGENNKGNIDPVLSAKLAKAIGVKLYTIGIGTGAGVPVPVQVGGGFAKASDGSVVITRLNEDVLKNMAKITGGQYFNADSKETLSKIYTRIGELERSTIKVKEYLNYYELFHFFAIAALILLFVEVIMTTTRFGTFP